MSTYEKCHCPLLQKEFIEDVKVVTKLIWLFLPLPVFWALFNQLVCYPLAKHLCLIFATCSCPSSYSVGSVVSGCLSFTYAVMQLAEVFKT